MYKIVFIVGSAHTNSLTGQVCNSLIQHFKNASNEDQVHLNIKMHIFDNVDIKWCKGCINCFTNGVCPLDEQDDMKYMKQDILEADIIVFACPVYFKGVSGCMKLFLDRLTYWTHIFRLAGKSGILISTCDQYGNSEVLDYLCEFANRLGLVNLKKISYTRTVDIPKSIEEQLNVISTKTLKGIMNHEHVFTSKQESIFKAYKDFIKQIPDCYEKNYWLESGMIECDSFIEYVEQQDRSKKCNSCH